ncbi:MAG TPA: ABC-type transport auxiliary lipoprotein family protein [Vineibacter sp.]|nr:ABC-type transport auxiliary lipoprotein family protein [Vineibacter sp.]
MTRRAAARAALLLGAVGILLGACAVLSAGDDPPNLYTLTPKSTFDPTLPQVTWQVVVETPTAAAYLNTSRIALAMTPTSADYYAKSAWTDRAPLLVQTLIVESLENSRRIIGVGRDPLAVRPTYVLQIELREFQAEYFHGKPPLVHVRLVARLVRQSDRQIVASRGFERCVRAGTDQVATVVQAFDEALGGVLKGLVAWTLTVAPPQPLPEGVPFPATRSARGGDETRDCPKSGS